MMAESNSTFGNLDRCLHCAAWDLIAEASPKAADGSPIFHAGDIITNLAEVLAELIASHPRAQRRRMCDQLNSEMRIQVFKKVQAGQTIPRLPASGVN